MSSSLSARPAPAASAVPTLIVLQQGTTSRPPICCFHPFGGSPAVYGALALALGAGHTVLGVQAAGLTPGREPDRTVPEMARRYAGSIRATGHRPAVYLGYSMGGVLAVETARLAGHAATVVVVDADPTYRSTRDDGWDILVRQVLNIDLAADRLDAMPRAEALTLVRAEAAARGRLPARFRLDRLDRMARVCEANAHAADLHRPRRYPATVHSLRGLSTEAAPDSWVGVADRVVVCRIDADHHGLLSVEGSASIAACLRERGLLPGP